MEKKQLKINHIRNGRELLTYTLYCSDEKKASNDEDFEGKLLRLTDKVGYYKSDRYYCFRHSPVISKLDLFDNPDSYKQK